MPGLGPGATGEPAAPLDVARRCQTLLVRSCSINIGILAAASGKIVMSRPLEMDPEGDWAYLRRSKRPAIKDGGPKTRIVDLFAGCGGMSLGAVGALAAIGRSPEVVLAVEIHEGTRAIYDANFKSELKDRRGDVLHRFNGKVSARLTVAERLTQSEAGAVDLLIGGPPCQGHSNLNNHTRGRDPKNALYLRMVRAAEVLEPSALVIENVPGVRLAEEEVVDEAKKRLGKLGYEVDDMIVSVASLGVPQLRRRHVLVATQTAIPLSFREQITSRYVDSVRTLRWAIGDLVDADATGLFDTAAQLSAENVKRSKFLLKNDKFDLPNRLRPPCHRDKSHRYKSMYGRMLWDEPAQTITTGFGSPGQGRYLHPLERRTLTPHEAARLQFFPDFFDFTSAEYRNVLANTVGNAVPPKLAFTVVHSLFAPLLKTQLGEGATDQAARGRRGNTAGTERALRP